MVLGTPSHIRNLPVFPATEQDAGDHTANLLVRFPTGNFGCCRRPSTIPASLTEMAKKIARTLIKRGCYLIDLGAGGWVICAEYGGTWSTANQWNGTECPDIEAMKRALRPVTSVSGWLDANGAAFTPIPWSSMNLLSMRGPYSSSSTDTVQSAISALRPRAMNFRQRRLDRSRYRSRSTLVRLGHMIQPMNGGTGAGTPTRSRAHPIRCERSETPV